MVCLVDSRRDFWALEPIPRVMPPMPVVPTLLFDFLAEFTVSSPPCLAQELVKLPLFLLWRNFSSEILDLERGFEVMLWFFISLASRVF